jgi:hypothetical protein
LAEGDRICRRAFSALKDETDNDRAMQALYHTGVWLLQHVQNQSDRLELARSCLERAVGNLRAAEYAEIRAAALANLATVLLLQEQGSRELNRVRARDSLNEALRILRSLPATPEREERIGLILMNRVRSGLEPD